MPADSLVTGRASSRIRPRDRQRVRTTPIPRTNHQRPAVLDPGRSYPNAQMTVRRKTRVEPVASAPAACRVYPLSGSESRDGCPALANDQQRCALTMDRVTWTRAGKRCQCPTRSTSLEAPLRAQARLRAQTHLTRCHAGLVINVRAREIRRAFDHM